MDYLNWGRCLVFWSKNIPEPGADTRVLCVGEGNGGLSLWFALQGCQVICSDYSGPTALAKELHCRHQVIDRITYAAVNVFSIPYDDNTFDLVSCKSVIGGLKKEIRNRRTRTLENQRLAVDEIRRVLKPGGFFCGAENMRGSYLHQTFRRLMKKERGWRYFAVPEMEFLFSNYSDVQCEFYGFLGSHFRSRFINRVTAGMDRLLSPLLPAPSKYICFFAARK